jgi:hypothetical protein
MMQSVTCISYCMKISSSQRLCFNLELSLADIILAIYEILLIDVSFDDEILLIDVSFDDEILCIGVYIKDRQKPVKESHVA